MGRKLGLVFCMVAFAACNQPTAERTTGGSGSGAGVSGGATGGASTGGSGSGGTCTQDSQCPGGDYCNYGVSACGTTLGSGDVEVPGSCEPNCGNACGACTSNVDCAPDETCESSECQPAVCYCPTSGPCDAPCAFTTPPHDCCPVCLCPSCPSGTSGGTSGGMTGGTSGSTSGGTTGGGDAGCDCEPEETCCPGVDHCVYLPDDTQNCGACGNPCPSSDICDNGTCTPAPCDDGSACGGLCCGQECCTTGQICCEVAGGPARQYPYSCAEADAGCPQPCLACADPTHGH